MKKLKLVLLAVALIFGMLAMVGCEEETEVGGNENPTTRTIIDGAGRSVEIPMEVTKVVTTWKPMSTILFSIQGGDKLVGIDNHSRDIEYYNIINPATGSLPTVGTKKNGVNIETVADVNPEVVFLYGGKNGEPFIEQLENLGIAVVVIDSESPEKVRSMTRLVGEVIGHEEQAEAVVKYYDDTITMIDDKLNAAGYTKDKRKVTHMFDGNGILAGPPGDYYQSFLMEAGGGITATRDLSGNGFKTVSAEELVMLNPEFIFANQFFKGDIQEEIDNAKGLESITAIKENKVYRFPAEMEDWDFPGAHSALGMLYIAKIVYPDVFADLDLLAETDSYYKQFYGKTFTELGGNLDEYFKPYGTKQ
jgi:iron complex transport system substrate-binding protein